METERLWSSSANPDHRGLEDNKVLLIGYRDNSQQHRCEDERRSDYLIAPAIRSDVGRTGVLWLADPVSQHEALRMERAPGGTTC